MKKFTLLMITLMISSGLGLPSAFGQTAEPAVDPEALQIFKSMINRINSGGAVLSAVASGVPPMFYDVNGDNSLSAADVLAVINHLNSVTKSGAEGEAPHPVHEFASAEVDTPHATDFAELDTQDDWEQLLKLVATDVATAKRQT